jgi:fructose/tagatose bisphosphate aldolase
MAWKSVKEMLNDLLPAQTLEHGAVKVSDRFVLVNEKLDRLVEAAVFSEKPEIKDACRWLIRACCSALGVHPASIQDYYMAKGQGRHLDVTVPALNLRGMTYDMARVAMRTAMELDAGALIFELARSEMSYTGQSPAEYATVVLAAALREGYEWPVFIQGDHFQVKASKYRENPEAELGALRTLIDESIAAGFYNIDIDSSTLVDLDKPTVREQQAANYGAAATLTKHVRMRQPKGVTISVGGEIGEVGGKNSTVEELVAFTEGYLSELGQGKGLAGPSKISVQTGTSHGGVVLPDGSLAQVSIDFKVLEECSRAAREHFGMAGAVQHGASTLPEGAFHHFPKTGCAEIHLATGFQNIILDSPHFPNEIKEEIYDFLRSSFAGEKKPSDSEDQFIYKTRKKAFGPFKKAFWSLPSGVMEPILEELGARFRLLFERLGTPGSAEGVVESVRPVPVNVPPPVSLTSF